MKLFEKIKSYIRKADETITEMAQEFNVMLNGYESLLSTTYDDVINTKNRVYNMGNMSVFEFVKNGPEEAEDIIEKTKENATKAYNNAKSIFTNFVEKQKQKMKKQKEQGLDDIVKKETKTYATTQEIPIQKETKNEQKKYGLKITNNYKKNITKIMNNYSSDISDLAQTISGKYTENKKKAWKWTDRIEKFEEYIQQNKEITKDKEGLKKIKETIQKNSYLKKNYKDTIYKQLLTKIDEAIKE